MKRKLLAAMFALILLACFHKLYAQQLVYENNFNGTSKDWPGYSSDKYALKAVSKGLTLTHNTPNFKPLFSGSASANFTSDYTMEASVGYITGDANGFEGISFASADNTNFYYFGYSSTGNYTVGGFIAGQFRALIAPTASSSIVQGKKFNKLAIVKKGDKLEFFINKVLVNSYTGLDPLGNSFGLLVSGKQTIIYNHLVMNYTGGQTGAANKNTNIFYQAAFSAADKVQWNFSGDSVVCTTKNGYYDIDSRAIGLFNINSGNSMVMPDLTKNFSIETSITQNRTEKATNSYGLVFDAGNADQYRFLVASSGGYALFRSSGDRAQSNLVIPWTHSDAIQPTGKPNRLKIEVRGNLLKLFINNAFVNEYAGYKPTGHGFGFIISSRQELTANYLTYTYLSNRQSVQQTVAATAQPLSRGLDVVVKKAQHTNVTGKYFALFIAVEKYKDPNIDQLNGPVSDAQKLDSVFKSEYNFPEKNVVFLQNPSRHDIFSSLHNLQQQIGDNDNLVIFYAGHGKLDKSTNEGYIFPADADKDVDDNWISNSDIRTQLKAFKAKHILVISDACYSGSLLTVDRGVDDNAPKEVSIALQNMSRDAITSGNADEEVPDDSNFIKYLVKALNDNADQYVTAQTLYSSFRRNVVNNSSLELPQDPKYGVIRATNDEQGDFVFTRK
jgi:hypothetical protein